MSSFRIEQDGLQGEIKPASSQDNPGELMIVSMPLAKNVNMVDKGNILTNCPLCGSDCWASSQIAAAASMYPHRMIATCTQCALMANMNKGSVPRLLQDRNLTADEVLQPILKLIQTKGNY